MIQPRRVELTPQGGLVIAWSDGHRAIHGPAALRIACQCAHCEDEWTGQRCVTAGDIPADIGVVESRPVGRYGLQFVWSDGHSTGIYSSSASVSCASAIRAGRAGPRDLVKARG